MTDPSDPPHPDEPRGAYGIALAGAAGAGRFLVPAPGWPVVEIVREEHPAAFEANALDGAVARVALGDGGGLVVERAARRAVFSTPRRLTDDELVHPYLAPVGGVFAWWWGREALHAGGVVVAGKVWAILGAKEAGKSSTLAWLALHGHQIACDDMLVVDRGEVLSGPRCLDLRPATARCLGVGELLPTAGPRERWRMGLGSVPPRLPLGGWVLLEWGDAVGVTPVPVSERLAALAPHRSLLVAPRQPAGLLDLLALPALRLRRPLSWDTMPAAMAALLDAVSRRSGAPRRAGRGTTTPGG